MIVTPRKGSRKKENDIVRMTRISAAEYAELDKAIEAAKHGGKRQIAIGRTCELIPISGLGRVRVWVYSWTIDDVIQGRIGWRAYGDDEGIAAFQAIIARYFADGVKAKSVVMHCPDGTTEKLR